MCSSLYLVVRHRGVTQRNRLLLRESPRRTLALAHPLKSWDPCVMMTRAGGAATRGAARGSACRALPGSRRATRLSSQNTCPFCSRNEVLLYSARGLDAPQYTDGVILSQAVHHAAHAPLVAMGSSPATEGHAGSPCGQLRALLGCALDYRRCTRPLLLCRGARAGARNDSVGCAPTAGAPCRLCARPWDASRRGRRGGRRVGWIWVAPCI